jgi:DNA-binding NtrC family response regulator
MITSGENARDLETVRRNGYSAARRKTVPSEADLSRQAEGLNQLAQLLAGAIEKLVATAEVLVLANVPDVALGVDFYAEMRRYELLLIQRALRQANGSQVRAAALLKLSPTTLNTKLKLYERRDGKVNERAAKSSLSS